MTASAAFAALAVLAVPKGVAVPLASAIPQRTPARSADDFAGPRSTLSPGVLPPSSARDGDHRLRTLLFGLDVGSESEIVHFLEQRGAASPPTSPEAVADLVREMTQLAKSPAYRLRRAAIAVLARIDPRNLESDPFTAALADIDAGTRQQAVIGCARHGIGRFEPAVAALSGDADERVRVAVAEALAKAHDAASRLVLARMLRDASDTVADAAAAALANEVSSQCLGAISLAARSPRGRVRFAASRVLAASRLEGAIVLMIELARDPVAEVRRAAIVGLAGVGLAGVELAGVELADVGEQHAAGVQRALTAIALDDRADLAGRFESVQSLAALPTPTDAASLLALADPGVDPLLRLAAARTELARGDTVGLGHLMALVGVAAGAPEDEERFEFVRAVATRTLRDVTDLRPRTNSESDWRELLPQLTDAFRAKPSRFVFARLVRAW